jgi:glutaconyl-CoA/methylmalonyl-CoA decarboxylase subunit gamma
MNEYNFVINGNSYKVNILKINEQIADVEVNGTRYEVNIEQLFQQKTPKVVSPPRVVESAITRAPLTVKPGQDISVKTVKAPLPGVILEVLIKVGDEVKASQNLLKMEAMKMENDIQSPSAGVVKEIFVSKGENVLEGSPLVKIE